MLRDLSLWDKRKAKIMELSGGMKRRVMIAKALSHEPEILFLDEPTAGVDVELRRDMWDLVRQLRDSGVTIILTTHYIEEAEEMADRVGVISKGELILVEEKAALMKKLGKKQLTLNLAEPMAAIPAELAEWELALKADGHELALRLRRQCRADRRPVAAAADERPRHRLQGPATPSRARSRTSSSAWSSEREGGMSVRIQPARRLGDLPVRDGARAAHPLAEPGHAGDHHLALFRRLRRGDRQRG